MSLKTILDQAARRYDRLPKWRRSLIEAERARDDEKYTCPDCLEEHTRGSRHWTWCAWR